ncbi:MAG TPA: helix-turn-helix transcriptional regulator [Gemmataceae bacterium]|jgi:plasmid maintenance system antidote protein VapI
MNERQTLAEALREAVRDSGRPVGAVARAAGVPQPVLSRFMAGTRGLSLETADRLAGYFGLTLVRLDGSHPGGNGHAA